MSPLYQTEVRVFLKNCEKKKKGERRGRGKEKEELGEGEEEEVGAEELEEDRKNFSVKKCCPRYLRLPSL